MSAVSGLSGGVRFPQFSQVQSGGDDQSQKIDSALKSQGLNDDQIKSLKSDLQSAVQQQVQSGSFDPSKLKSTLDSVFKNHGVDTSKLQASLGQNGNGGGFGGPPPFGGPGGGAPPGGAIGGKGKAGATTSNNDIEQLLQILGDTTDSSSTSSSKSGSAKSNSTSDSNTATDSSEKLLQSIQNYFQNYVNQSQSQNADTEYLIGRI